MPYLSKKSRLFHSLRLCHRLSGHQLPHWLTWWDTHRAGVSATLQIMVGNWLDLQKIFHHIDPPHDDTVLQTLQRIAHDNEETLRQQPPSWPYRPAAAMQLSWVERERAQIHQRQQSPSQASAHWGQALKKGEEGVKLLADNTTSQVFYDYFSCVNEWAGFLHEQQAIEQAEALVNRIERLAQDWRRRYPQAQDAILAGMTDVKLTHFSHNRQRTRSQFDALVQDYQRALTRKLAAPVRGQIYWHRGLAYCQLAMLSEDNIEKLLVWEHSLNDWQRALSLVESDQQVSLIQWARVHVMEQCTSLIEQGGDGHDLPVFEGYAKLVNKRLGKKSQPFAIHDLHPGQV